MDWQRVSEVRIESGYLRQLAWVARVFAVLLLALFAALVLVSGFGWWSFIALILLVFSVLVGNAQGHLQVSRRRLVESSRIGWWRWEKQLPTRVYTEIQLTAVETAASPGVSRRYVRIQLAGKGQVPLALDEHVRWYFGDETRQFTDLVKRLAWVLDLPVRIEQTCASRLLHHLPDATLFVAREVSEPV